MKEQTSPKRQWLAPVLLDLTAIGHLTAGGTDMNNTELFFTCSPSVPNDYQYAPTTSGGVGTISC